MLFCSELVHEKVYLVIGSHEMVAYNPDCLEKLLISEEKCISDIDRIIIGSYILYPIVLIVFQKSKEGTIVFEQNIHFAKQC